MPAFLEAKLRKEYGNNPRAIYGDDWSWLAGLFEGEGTAGMYPSFDKRAGRTNRHRLVMTITQKERDMLDEAKRITGSGSIHFSKSWNGFIWTAASRSARVALTKLFPYLRSPRRKIQVAAALAEDERLRAEGRQALSAHRHTAAVERRDATTGRFHA